MSMSPRSKLVLFSLLVGILLTATLLLWPDRDARVGNDEPDTPPAAPPESAGPVPGDLCLQPVPDGMDSVSLTEQRIALTGDFLQGLIAEDFYWQEMDLIVEAVELPPEAKEALVLSSLEFSPSIVDPTSPVNTFTQGTAAERRHLDAVLNSPDWQQRLAELPEDSDRKVFGANTLYSRVLASPQINTDIVRSLLDRGFEASQVDVAFAVTRRIDPVVIRLMIDNLNNTRPELFGLSKSMPTVGMVIVRFNQPDLLKHWLDKVPDSGLEDYGINELDLQPIPVPGKEEDALEVMKVLLDAGRSYATRVGYQKLQTWAMVNRSDRIHPPIHEVNANIEPRLDSLESMLSDNTAQLQAALDREQQCQPETADDESSSPAGPRQRGEKSVSPEALPPDVMDEMFANFAAQLLQGMNDPKFVSDFQAALKQNNWPVLLEQMGQLRGSEAEPGVLQLLVGKALATGVSEEVLDDLIEAGAEVPEDAIVGIAGARQYQMLDILLARGVDPGRVNLMGMNALGVVAKVGDSSAPARAFFNRLIELGVSVNTDTEVIDPLHHALNAPTGEAAAYYAGVLLNNGAIFKPIHREQLAGLQQTNPQKYHYLITTVPEFAEFLPDEYSPPPE